jgi:DNA polymerase III sliding clamp (beta) subunit (PCNA family)
MKIDTDKLRLQLKVLGSICKRDHVTLDGTYTSVWSDGESLITTDGEMTLFCKSPFILDKPVNCGQFYEALRRAKGATNIAQRDGSLFITSGNGVETSIDFLKIETPKFPKPYKSRRTAVSFGEGTLAYASRAMSSEMVRYALKGVCLDGGLRRMVGSDGKRLHTLAFSSERKFDPVVIPSEAVNVLRMIEDAGGKVMSVALSGEPKETAEKAQVTVGDFTLDCKLIMAPYPDYAAVFPKGYHWTVQMDADILKKALKDACKFLNQAKEKSFAAQFDRRDGKLQLVVRSLDEKTSGVATYPLVVYKTGGDLDGVQWFTINPKYFLDSLWTSRVTTLQGSTTDTPLLVDGVSLVCPIKPQTGPERAYLEDVAKRYKETNATEKPVEPARTRTPDGEAVQVACPTFARCITCGVNMKVQDKDLCDICAKNAKVETPRDLHLPEFERVPRIVYTLRKKKLRDAQYDIHEVWNAK